MSCTVMGIGRYKGITLPQLLFKDLDWFYWAFDKGILNGRIPTSEVQDIYEKSRNIKIPQSDLHAVFVFDGIRGVFADLKLVPEDRPNHVETSKTQRLGQDRYGADSRF